jgi:DNA-binding transcriptional ArsR family regulator
MKRDIFQAIADPTRRKILSLTLDKSMTPNELVEHFRISRQAVSKHIKILTESRLLEQEPAGREIYYRIKADKLREIDKWLEKFRSMWEDRFNELDTLLKKHNKKRRH